jgi:hypothetical protein
MERGEAKTVSFAQPHCAVAGSANPRRVRQHGLEHKPELTGRAADDLQHLVGRRLPLQGLAQLAPRLRELAFEIASGFLRHLGRPMPSRLDAERLKFYATLGKPSMVQVFRFYSITSSARASSIGSIVIPSALAPSLAGEPSGPSGW